MKNALNRSWRNTRYPSRCASTSTTLYNPDSKLSIVFSNAVFPPSTKEGILFRGRSSKKSVSFNRLTIYISPEHDMRSLFVFSPFAVQNFCKTPLVNFPFKQNIFTKHARLNMIKNLKANEKFFCIMAFYCKINLHNSAESVFC